MTMLVLPVNIYWLSGWDHSVDKIYDTQAWETEFKFLEST